MSAGVLEALLVLIGTCALGVKTRVGGLVMFLLWCVHAPASFLAMQMARYCPMRVQTTVSVILMVLVWVAVISVLDLISARSMEPRISSCEPNHRPAGDAGCAFCLHNDWSQHYLNSCGLVGAVRCE